MTVAVVGTVVNEQRLGWLVIRQVDLGETGREMDYCDTRISPYDERCLLGSQDVVRVQPMEYSKRIMAQGYRPLGVPAVGIPFHVPLVLSSNYCGRC